MKEIEILVKIESQDFIDIKKKISTFAKLKSRSKVVDTYFFDPLRSNLKPNHNMSIKECFRLRNKDKRYYLTYKKDKFDISGKWLYSDENESEVYDVKEIYKIIKNLGLKKLIVVDMRKEYYENEQFIIAVEFVKYLGAFLEVESKKQVDKEDKIILEKYEIEKFIKRLGFSVSKDLGVGKPELLLKYFNKIK